MSEELKLEEPQATTDAEPEINTDEETPDVQEEPQKRPARRHEPVTESMDDYKEELNSSLRRIYPGDIMEGEVVASAPTPCCSGKIARRVPSS